MARMLEFIFFIYFLTHIPITILIDSQAIFPEWMYSKQLLELMDWYTTEYKDALMASPPVWFKSFVVSEIFLQLPFFFFGTYAFYKGVCRWIRIPALIYSSHVATTLIAILAHILFHDFNDSKHPGPETLDERLMLASFYLPYFVVPVLMILTMLFHPDYATNTKQKAH